MSDDDLTERIARALYGEAYTEGRYPGDWRDENPAIREHFLALAAAVLPIIAAEVRKGRAAALREAAGDIAWSAETLPHMTPHDAARGLVRRAERIEQED